MAARQWMSLALGWIGLSALATGCADDGVSLHVICPIPPDIEDDSCTWDPGSDLCVAEGLLNLKTANSYRLSLRVQSGLKARMRDVPPLGEPNGMQVDEAWIELRVSSGARIDGITYPDPGDPKGERTIALPNPFKVSASGYVAPAGSAIVGVTAIDSNYMTALKSTSLRQVVLAIKLHGKTNGEEDVDSAEYLWPIDLILASPFEADQQCVSGRPWCNFGQDEGAYSCSDSST